MSHRDEDHKTGADTDFNEKFGSMDDFAKRSVSSLFAKPTKGDGSMDIPPVRRRDATPAARPSEGAVRRRLPEPDPETQYEKYLEEASQANRRERERERASRERAIIERDEKLRELPPSRMPKQKPALRARSIGSSAVGVLSNLNMRNIAIAGGVVVLIIFAVFTWRLVAANGRAADAQARVTELELEINGLNAELESVNYQLAQARAQQTQPPETQQPGSPAADPEENQGAGEEDQNGEEDGPGAPTPTPTPTPTPPTIPGTTVDAYGRRIYVVQDGDSAWAIAQRFLGDGARYPEIMQASGLTAADAGTLRPGMQLIIP